MNKPPETIVLRSCPYCKAGRWSINGFAYPAGDDSHWECIWCRYKGKPMYERFALKVGEKIDTGSRNTKNP